MSTYLATVSYWRAASRSRDQEPAIAMTAQATLWNIAQSPSCPERVKDAAFRHLAVLGNKPDPYGVMIHG